MKIRLYDFLIKCLVMHMVLTLTFTLWPDFLPFRRILGGIIATVVAMIIVKNAKRYQLTSLLLLFIIIVFSSWDVSNISIHLSDVIYFSVTIMMLLECTDSDFVMRFRQEIRKNKRLILFAVLLVHIATIFALFIPTGYTDNWGGGYFKGFSEGGHLLGAGFSTAMTMIYAILKIDGEKKVTKVICFFPSAFFIVMSGARTFLIPALLIIILWMFYECPNTSSKLLIIPIISVGLVQMILNSNFLKKTISSASNQYTSGRLIDRLTNGRTIFWGIDINAFLNFDLFHKIFGYGFDFVYALNLNKYGLEIWAHNDFINTLLGIGIIGTVFYIIVFIKLFNFLAKNLEMHPKKRLVLSILFVYSVGIALLNGFFGYQHYLFGFVFLLCTVVLNNQGDIIYEQY